MKFLQKQKYAVIDLETTGNRAQHGDEIIQIGICTIEGGKVVDTYQTLIKPGVEIPAFIENLTGIHNQDVQGAPIIDDVLPEVLKRLDQACLIAHNPSFDLSFLQTAFEKAGYMPFRGMVIDTVELARVFLPTQDSYRLSQLTQALHIKHQNPHRADSDALATALLFIQLTHILWELPLITLERLITLAGYLQSDIRLLLQEVLLEKQQTNTSEVEAKFLEDRQLELYRGFAIRRRKQSAAEGYQKWRHILATEHFLSKEAIKERLEAILPFYEERPTQLSYYEAVCKAFRDEAHALIEAGTGTGKTLAYLLAAVQHAAFTQEKVVISTHTLTLQEQLVQSDLPLVEKLLKREVPVATLKGKSNYLCLKKFEYYLYHQPIQNHEQAIFYMQILVWLTQTETGDIEELQLTRSGHEGWQSFACEGGSCFVQRDGKAVSKCFYVQAREAVKHADIVITNHALMLSDVRYEHALPSYSYAIVDEAHHLEHVTQHQFGLEMSLHQWLVKLQRMGINPEKDIIERVWKALILHVEGQSLSQLLESFQRQFTQWYSHLEQMVQTLEACFLNQKVDAEEGNKRLLRIKHDELKKKNPEAWERLLQELELVADDALAWIKSYEQIKEQIYRDHEGYPVQQIVTEWISEVQQVIEGLEKLNSFFQRSSEKEVYWMEYLPNQFRASLTLHMYPVFIHDTLSERFFMSKKSVVLTSATLKIGDSFSFCQKQLGFPEENVLSYSFTSPFCYEKQSKLLVINDIPSVTENNFGYLEKVAEVIRTAIDITQGRALILFTSYRALKQVYELVKEPLSRRGIHLLAQGIDSSSKHRLIKQFQNIEGSVLFGTSTFWEGIDIPGEVLSCLIITRLPFSVPQLPIAQARRELLEKQAKNEFREYALPEAVLRFKQGIGRLVRRQSDRGVIIVTDSRLVQASYGKKFIQSLPGIPVASIRHEELKTEIEQWFT